jgi:hypothetical protein
MPTMPARLPAAVLALLLGYSAVLATPANRKAFAEHFGTFLAKKLNDCRLCHLPEAPGTFPGEESERPHNAFGQRLKELRHELKQAGKPSDIISRFQVIALEDSDGDGIPNLVELLTGHNPGDPNDKPTAAELSQAKQREAEFRKYLAGYRWRPFEVVRRPAVPTVKHTAWVRNPIDAFLAAEHEARGLQPRPEADRATLLRRVYLDLIGLPPTVEELQAYLNDSSPNAYEKVVDKLLASPQYGQRWGRHWMDVWRYSDWAGYGMELRESQPFIWQWRDWIVESLNADKGYDRMLQEMLAGDELAPLDPATLRATGFLARNWYRFNRNVWLDHTVEHTAKAFLGVTLNCARCHDHMYDPIAQTEYYAFRAIFEPYQVRLDRLPGEPDLNKLGLARVYDADAQVPTYLFVRGNEATPDKEKIIPPAVPKALGGTPLQIKSVALPRDASHPERQLFIVHETLATSEKKVRAARLGWDKARAEILFAVTAMVASSDLKTVGGRLASEQTKWNKALLLELQWRLAQADHAVLLAVLQAEALEDAGKKESHDWQAAAQRAQQRQREQAVLAAQLALLKIQQAGPQTPSRTEPPFATKVKAAQDVLAKAEAALKQPVTTAYIPRPQATYPAASTGRRLALAKWISDKQNPLTARVAANHLWLRHFGKPLVATVFDFGQNGQPPTHPALLDWLAAEFMEHGWSMKHMHRLLVTSSAYRMASTADDKAVSLDPDNRYLWRMHSRRMEAETVRDSVLHVAGLLDLSGGGQELNQDDGLTTFRRSLYYRHANEKQMVFLTLFDAPSANECYQRYESIVPQQALALANSSLVHKAALELAKRFDAQVDESVFVRQAFLRILCRPPSPQEEKLCRDFLQEQRQLLRQQTLSGFVTGQKLAAPAAAEIPLRVRANLIRVLFNHHEFVTVR